MLTALIVDEEPLERVHLRRLLEDQGVEVVGEAGGAAEALEKAETLRPDLLTLDIQATGLSWMQVANALRQLDTSPLLVFATGAAEHAAQAFDQNVLDYLLKPIGAERVARMLVRVRERLADRQARQQGMGRGQEQTAPPPLTRLPIRGDYKVTLLRVEEILFAAAREKRVYIRTKEGEHCTQYTLTQLEHLLPSDRFLRIHDSCLVHLDRVEELLFLGNHSYMVRLEGDLQLPVGRRRYVELHRRLSIGALGLQAISTPRSPK